MWLTPPMVLVKYNRKQFLAQWQSDKEEQMGVCLLIEPSPEFYQENPHEKKKLRFDYLLAYLRPFRKYIIQLLLGLLTGSLISLIFPYLTQSIVDVGINNRDIGFVVLYSSRNWCSLLAKPPIA